MSAMPPAQGNRYCQTCRNPVWDNTGACTQCGDFPAAGRNFCFYCGLETAPDTNYCGRCGAAIAYLPRVEELGLWGYFVKCMKNYAQFDGRARRKEFWGFSLFSTLFSLVPVLGSLWNLAALVPTLAVTWRRFHDRGHSGVYFILICLMAVAGAFLIGIGILIEMPILWVFAVALILVAMIVNLVITCSDSQPGDNRFGPNPKGR